MSIRPPCGKDCPRREVGCQGKCANYKAFRAEIDATKPQVYGNAEFVGYREEIMRRIARRSISNIRRNFTKDK